MLLTGFIVSIPVFFDVGLVIVSSILFSLTKRTGKSLLYFGLPLAGAMATTHAFVPPTPGPAYVAYDLGVDMGTMIVVGILIGLPTSILATIIGVKMGTKLFIPVPEALDIVEQKDEANLPNFGLVAFIIALPIFLILFGTGIERFVLAAGIEEGLELKAYNAELAERLRSAPIFYQLLTFCGKPMIALIIGTIVAMLFLGIFRGVSREKLLELSTKSLGPAGIIILITGAGGVFKTILKETGIADGTGHRFQWIHAAGSSRVSPRSRDSNRPGISNRIHGHDLCACWNDGRWRRLHQFTDGICCHCNCLGSHRGLSCQRFRILDREPLLWHDRERHASVMDRPHDDHRHNRLRARPYCEHDFLILLLGT